MKSQFPGLSGSKQEANADCHIASGGRFICRRKQRSEGGDTGLTDAGRWGKSVANLSRLFLFSSFFFPLPFYPIMRWGQTEPLCIGLINSYSSSAWHPGNRSGFALGLIFRPVEDSQSIRELLRQHAANFPETPKEARGRKGENERVIEGGIDDIGGETGGGEIKWREIGRGRKSERGWAASPAVIYDV